MVPRPPRLPLFLPDSAREAMRVPLGPLAGSAELPKLLAESGFTVAVGDVVTLTLLRLGIRVDVAVFDCKTMRGEMEELRGLEELAGGERLRASNPAATLTEELWDALEKAFALASEGSPVRLVVEGEEDLAAIPAILLAPDGAKVIYGMPGKGAVVVSVDEETRRRARELLDMLVPGNSVEN